MLATSHACWTSWLARDAAWRWWAIAGSVAPDAPAIGRVAWLRTRDPPGQRDVARIYEQAPWRQVHRAAHAVWPPLALAAVARDPRVRALAAGWAGHLAVDLASHSDDAWPPLWPLSQRRLRSPLSYWQRDRHATLVMAADLTANLLILRGRPSAVAAVAVVATSASLIARTARRDRAVDRRARPLCSRRS